MAFGQDVAWLHGTSCCVQPGKDMCAAGYCLYGSSCCLVLSVGDGVSCFTLDPSMVRCSCAKAASDFLTEWSAGLAAHLTWQGSLGFSAIGTVIGPSLALDLCSHIRVAEPLAGGVPADDAARECAEDGHHLLGQRGQQPVLGRCHDPVRWKRYNLSVAVADSDAWGTARLPVSVQ